MAEPLSREALEAWRANPPMGEGAAVRTALALWDRLDEAERVEGSLKAMLASAATDRDECKERLDEAEQEVIRLSELSDEHDALIGRLAGDALKAERLAERLRAALERITRLKDTQVNLGAAREIAHDALATSETGTPTEGDTHG